MGKKFPSTDCYLTYEDYEKALKNREYDYFDIVYRINKYKGKRFESALECYKNNLVFNKVTKKWIKRSNVDNNIKNNTLINANMKIVNKIEVNEEEEEPEDEEASESSTEELETTFSHLSVSNSGKENYNEYSTRESHFVPIKQSVVSNRISTDPTQNQQSNVMMTFSRISTQPNETNRNNSSHITSSSKSSFSSSAKSSSIKKHSSTQHSPPSSPSSPSSPPSPPVLLPSSFKTQLPKPSQQQQPLNQHQSGEKVRISDNEDDEDDDNDEKNRRKEKENNHNNNNYNKIKTEPVVALPSSSCKEKTNQMKIIQPQLKQNPAIKEQSNKPQKEEIKNISILFDTNYYLDYLDNIESYLKRSLKVYNNKHSTLQSLVSMIEPYYFMIVPQQVIVELDGLKLSNNSNTASKARKASRMLVDSLSQYKDKILFLQSDSEIYYGKGIHENPSILKNDDRILNCALYYSEVKKDDVYLITGDNVLVLKCASHNIKCYNDREFVVFMNDKLPLF